MSVARIRAVGEAESDTVKRFCVMQEVMLVYDCRSVCVCVWCKCVYCLLETVKIHINCHSVNTSFMICMEEVL